MIMHDSIGMKSCIRHRWSVALAAGAMSLAATIGYAQEATVDSWALVATDAQKTEAAAAGAADGGKAGAAVAVPTGKKIGVMLLSGQSASSQRILAAARTIAQMLGYEVIDCDPNFDAQKVGQCATSLVAQKADVIFSVSQNPGPMGSALADAKDLGITWIGTVDAVTPSPIIIPYGAPGPITAKVKDTWLFAEMAKRKGDGAKLQVMALTAPTVGVASLEQEQTLLADAQASDAVEVVVKHDLDLANIVQDTLSTTTQTLQQYPDLAGTWTVCDFCVPLIAQAVNAAGVPAEKRPVIAGNYTTAQTIADLRKGAIDGVVDLPWETAVWVGMDQVLQKWARDKEIMPSFDVFSTAYGMKFMEPYMVTKENVGASGPAPVFGPDFESYFRAKWKAEFGVGG